MHGSTLLLIIMPTIRYVSRQKVNYEYIITDDRLRTLFNQE